MPDRIAEHYERNAHAFDAARRGQFVEKAWLDRFLLGVPRGGRVLDLGCGGGEPIARYLIDRSCQVIGVDLSQTMIGLARTRFARHQWLQGDMRTVALDGPFDGALAWDSLFHLAGADQSAVIARVAAGLAPGGMLLFNTGPAQGEAIGCQFGEALYHASLDPGAYRALFTEHGLVEIAFAPDDFATGGRSVWLARKSG
jgi:2-polyprenyl-3-methyl-5-hydroxy-6-metoxy-1,4-benzoquinol methylase